MKRNGKEIEARAIATTAHKAARTVLANGSNKMVNSLFELLAATAKQQMGNFEPQGISNTAWAFATAGQKNEPLFAASARAAEQRMKEFKAQEISSTAWAFATAGQKNEPLFAALA